MFALVLFFAPLPLAKAPAKPASPVGEWEMTWRSGSGPTRFDADGTFWCVWNEKLWKGKWKLEDRVLSVEESMDAFHGGSTPLKWTVKLEKIGWEGEIDSGWEGLGGPNRFILKKR